MGIFNAKMAWLLALSVCFLLEIAMAKLVEVNRVVARVNDKVITWGEIELAMENLNFSDEERMIRAREFINGKVDRLLSQYAFKNYDENSLQAYVEQEYSSKLMSNFNGDRRLFREVLQSSGQSPLEYKEQLKEDIIHMHMLSYRKRTGDEISPQSVEDYYNKNSREFRTEKRMRLKEIVFSNVDAGSDETLESTARKVHSRIIKGEDFDSLASSTGESPFRSKSGDWGVFVAQNEIRNQQIRKVAFSLKENEVSQPFEVNLLGKSADGSIKQTDKRSWYILKVIEVEPAKQLPIEEVRSEIERIIARNLELGSQRKWLSRQKRDAFVDITLPE